MEPVAAPGCMDQSGADVVEAGWTDTEESGTASASLVDCLLVAPLQQTKSLQRQTDGNPHRDSVGNEVVDIRNTTCHEREQP